MVNDFNPVTGWWYLWFLGQVVIHMQSEQTESVCIFFLCVYMFVYKSSLMNLYPWKKYIQIGWDMIRWPRCFPLLCCDEVVKSMRVIISIFFKSNYSQMVSWPRREVHLSREDVIACCGVKKAFYLSWFYFIKHCNSHMGLCVCVFFLAHLLFFKAWQPEQKAKITEKI